jgi:hypothetical protein
MRETLMAGTTLEAACVFVELRDIAMLEHAPFPGEFSAVTTGLTG